MLCFRNPIYEYSAHLKVSVDHKTVEEIVGEICRNYEIMTRGTVEEGGKTEI